MHSQQLRCRRFWRLLRQARSIRAFLVSWRFLLEENLNTYRQWSDWRPAFVWQSPKPRSFPIIQSLAISPSCRVLCRVSRDTVVSCDTPCHSSLPPSSHMHISATELGSDGFRPRWGQSCPAATITAGSGGHGQLRPPPATSSRPPRRCKVKV